MVLGNFRIFSKISSFSSLDAYRHLKKSGKNSGKSGRKFPDFPEISVVLEFQNVGILHKNSVSELSPKYAGLVETLKMFACGGPLPQTQCFNRFYQPQMLQHSLVNHLAALVKNLALLLLLLHQISSYTKIFPLSTV